jgi:hypothetical protein
MQHTQFDQDVSVSDLVSLVIFASGCSNFSNSSDEGEVDRECTFGAVVTRPFTWFVQTSPTRIFGENG